MPKSCDDIDDVLSWMKCEKSLKERRQREGREAQAATIAIRGRVTIAVAFSVLGFFGFIFAILCVLFPTSLFITLDKKKNSLQTNGQPKRVKY